MRTHGTYGHRAAAAVVIIALLLGFFGTVRPAQAESYTVDSLTDTGTGSGTSGDLRYVIMQANASPGPHTISISIGGTISLHSALPPLTQSLTITGPAVTPLTIDGASAFAILSVGSGITVNLSALTLANASDDTANGGAIANLGTLNISSVTFSNNSAGSAFGGAIYNSGTLNIANSTFSGNSAGSGGAIYNQGGTLNLLNDTFANNHATADGAVVNNQGQATMLNTIVTATLASDNTPGRDCHGLTDGDNNLSDGSCPATLAAETGLTTTLSDNGGPTQTFALLPGSNAIDNVTTCAYPPDFGDPLFDAGQNIPTDQRGTARPQSGQCDIGAFELSGRAIGIQGSASLNLTAGSDTSQTLTASGGTFPYRFAANGTLPAGLSLTVDGRLSGTPSQTGTFSVPISARDAQGFTGSRALSLTIACPTIQILPQSLPNGAADAVYSAGFSQTGGIMPVNYAVSGVLPLGVQLQNGVVGGIPAQSGTFSITVIATDSNNCSAQRNYTIGIAPAPAAISRPTIPAVTNLIVMTTTLPLALSGSYYSQTIIVSGGVTPYRYSIISGTLPPGLSLSTDGTISGTPTQPGAYLLTLSVTDTNGNTITQTYSLNVS